MATVIDEQDVTILEDSVETVLIDADLFIKYNSPEKAFKLLRGAIDRNPHSISLREKMRDIANLHRNLDEATEQCLALASIYIRRSNFDLAYDRLQEAKSLDPRISIASGLEAIRIARMPSQSGEISRKPIVERPQVVLSGDIELISIFDAVQVIENSRLTGLLVLKSDQQIASLAFNNGKIVDAQAEGMDCMAAFRKIIEISQGKFEFTRSNEPFPAVISVASNKNFLLNTLASLEAERAEKKGIRDIRDEELEY
ncbi:MAG: DUF4388 domain-containing protein [Pyrinomonadaceae bacterium]